MKKILAILALGSIIAASCSKENSSNTATYPSTEALKANDTTTAGIYKGIIVGSSGTIKFVINNNGNATVKAYIAIDSVLYDTLTTTTTFVNGMPVTAVFTGNHGNAFTLTIGKNGTAPTLSNITIVGHPNINIQLFKELSTQKVFCYEGKNKNFLGQDRTFNVLRCGNSVLVLIRYNNDVLALAAKGTVSADNKFTVSTTWGTNNVNTMTVSGTFNADNTCTGTWNYSGVQNGVTANTNGEFSAKQTL